MPGSGLRHARSWLIAYALWHALHYLELTPQRCRHSLLLRSSTSGVLYMESISGISNVVIEAGIVVVHD